MSFSLRTIWRPGQIDGPRYVKYDSTGTLINVDKFKNFRNYYWTGVALTPTDLPAYNAAGLAEYYVIEKGGETDWSVYNFWTHVSQLKKSDLGKYAQAEKPIIEFNKNLEGELIYSKSTFGQLPKFKMWRRDQTNLHPFNDGLVANLNDEYCQQHLLAAVEDIPNLAVVIENDDQLLTQTFLYAGRRYIQSLVNASFQREVGGITYPYKALVAQNLEGKGTLLGLTTNDVAIPQIITLTWDANLSVFKFKGSCTGVGPNCAIGTQIVYAGVTVKPLAGTIPLEDGDQWVLQVKTPYYQREFLYIALDGAPRTLSTPEKILDADENFRVIKGTVAERDGIWEVPPQLKWNIKNETRSEISLGDLYYHFSSIIEAQPTLDGSSTGDNNWRNIDGDVGLGGKIKQFDGNIPLFISMLLQDGISHPTLIEFAKQSYNSLFAELKVFIEDELPNLIVEGKFNPTSLTIVDGELLQLFKEYLAHRSQVVDASATTIDDNIATTFYDSTSSLSNLVVTLPYLGLAGPVQPKVALDLELNMEMLVHHDGHRSQLTDIDDSVIKRLVQKKFKRSSGQETPGEISGFTAPSKPYRGQFWYKTANAQLYFYDVISDTGEQPLDAQNGDYSFDRQTNNLSQFNGTAWIFLGNSSSIVATAWRVLDLSGALTNLTLAVENELYINCPPLTNPLQDSPEVDEGRLFSSMNVQRMTPKFFTVDGPRSMSFALTTDGDSLRVDYTSRTASDLCGLKWFSEDTKDHAKLKYETKKDYRNVVWTFDLTVDNAAPYFSNPQNAISLTVNGRDETGSPVTYIVALFNYAVAPDTRNSRIVIDFNTVKAGFFADIPMYVGDIDDMFISVIASSYTGVNTPLDAPTQGWLAIANNKVTGSNSMMKLGVADVSGHSLGLSTSYDDHYDQSPERILDNMYSLGYRDWINHYVGMSIFPEKTWDADQSRFVVVTVDDVLDVVNNAAKIWHADFATRANAKGYKLIQSVSYETFSENAQLGWTQRDYNDNYGQTGYTPPSYLLSPCNVPAMNWLKEAFIEFGAIANAAGLDVYLQVGEPWWWFNPSTGLPCVYDNATRLKFNDETGLFAPDLGTIFSAQSNATPYVEFRSFLRQELGFSVQRIRTAIKAAFPSAQVSVLPFLPTIIGKGFMEEINLPNSHYAYPNFDFFQTEAYDYLIGTVGDPSDAALAMTYPIATLGYPANKVQYLAGFAPEIPPTGVTRADIWNKIFSNIQENESYGVAKQHVWAYTLVMRDSITYNEINEQRIFFENGNFNRIAPTVAPPLTLESNALYSPLMQREFEAFGVYHGVSDVYGAVFDTNNAFTWNYTDSLGVASWHVHYQEIYGTSRPDIQPWIPAGYATEAQMMADLADQSLTVATVWTTNLWAATGIAEYLRSHYILNGKPDFLSVDLISGALLPPYSTNSESALSVPPNSATAPFAFGSMGPVELLWTRTLDYLYARQKVFFKLNPLNYIKATWGIRYETLGNYEFNAQLSKKTSAAELQLHGDILQEALSTDQITFSLLSEPSTNQVYTIKCISRLHNVFKITGGELTTPKFVTVGSTWNGAYISFTLIRGARGFFYGDTFTLTVSDEISCIPTSAQYLRTEGFNQLYVQYLRAFGQDKNVSLNRTLFNNWDVKLGYRFDSLINTDLLKIKNDNETVTKTSYEVLIKENKFTKSTWLNAIKVTLAREGSSDRVGKIQVPKGTPPGTDWVFRVDSFNPARPQLSWYSFNTSGPFETFTALDGSGTSYSWKRYLEKTSLNTVAAPFLITGIQNIVNFIFGYADKMKVDGWHFNDQDDSVFDPSTGRAINYQLLIEQFVDMMFSGVQRGASFVFNPFAEKVWFETERGVVTALNENIGMEQETVPKLLTQNLQQIPLSDVRVFRQDEMTQFVFDQPAYTFHLLTSEYEHVLLLNDYSTKDTLFYDAFLGQVIPTIFIEGRKQNNPTGRLDFGGHFLLGGEMKRNIESSVKGISQLYETAATIPGLPEVERARATLGFAHKDYFSDRETSDQAEFRFWQGMISRKGTNYAVDAYLNSSKFSTASLDEFWAYKIASYGDARTGATPEMRVHLSDVVSRQRTPYLFLEKGESNVFTNNFGFDEAPLDVGVFDFWSIYGELADGVESLLDPRNCVIVDANDEQRWVSYDDLNSMEYVELELISETLVTGATTAGQFITILDNKKKPVRADVFEIVNKTTGQVYYERGQYVNDDFTTPSFKRINHSTILLTSNLGSGSFYVRAYGPPISSFSPSQVYNTSKNVLTKDDFVWWDPARGSHHPAIGEVDYIIENDPAIYNSANTTHRINHDKVWGANEVGRIWWNTTGLEYQPYSDTKIYQDNNDRLNRWGSLAEHSEVKVYEWIASDVPPSEYKGDLGLNRLMKRARTWQQRPIAWKYSANPESAQLDFLADLPSPLEVIGNRATINRGRFKTHGLTAGTKIAGVTYAGGEVDKLFGTLKIVSTETPVLTRLNSSVGGALFTTSSYFTFETEVDDGAMEFEDDPTGHYQLIKTGVNIVMKHLLSGRQQSIEVRDTPINGGRDSYVFDEFGITIHVIAKYAHAQTWPSLGTNTATSRKNALINALAAPHELFVRFQVEVETIIPLEYQGSQQLFLGDFGAAAIPGTSSSSPSPTSPGTAWTTWPIGAPYFIVAPNPAKRTLAINVGSGIGNAGELYGEYVAYTANGIPTAIQLMSGSLPNGIAPLTMSSFVPIAANPGMFGLRAHGSVTTAGSYSAVYRIYATNTGGTGYSEFTLSYTITGTNITPVVTAAATPSPGPSPSPSPTPSPAPSGINFGWVAWNDPAINPITLTPPPLNQWEPVAGEWVNVGNRLTSLATEITSRMTDPWIWFNGDSFVPYRFGWSQWTEIVPETRSAMYDMTDDFYSTNFTFTETDSELRKRARVYINGALISNHFYTIENGVITISTEKSVLGHNITIIVVPQEITKVQLEFNPDIEDEDPLLVVQYKRDNPYVLRESRGSSDTKSVKTYYFWIANKESPAAQKKLNVKQIAHLLARFDDSFCVPQILKWADQIDGRPNRYAMIYVENLGHYVNEEDSFKIRFKDKPFLRTDDKAINLKNIHEEWVLIRPYQATRIPQKLWALATDTVASINQIGESLPNPSLSLYEERTGNNASIGPRRGQLLTSVAAAREAVKFTINNTRVGKFNGETLITDYISYPGFDVANVDSYLATSESAREFMSNLWRFASAKHINEIFFAIFEDGISRNLEMPDFFKTSYIALNDIRTVEFATTNVDQNSDLTFVSTESRTLIASPGAVSITVASISIEHQQIEL